MVSEPNIGNQGEYEDPNSIKLSSRRLACENAVYSVFLDHVKDTEGHEVVEYLSVLPKRILGDIVTGVCVLPVKDGKFGLIRVFRHPMGRWSWEAPKGFIDLDESPEQSVIRELHEETGFMLSRDKLCDLGSTAPEAGLIKGRVKLYSAMLNTDCEFGFIPDELGHGKLVFFERSEIAELITFGQIEDACTLSALFLHFIRQEHWLELKTPGETRKHVTIGYPL
jgi:ADP-ribose pyrophosphatase